MEQVSRRGEATHNDNHLRNFQNNLQPRYSPNDDVQYEPVNLALTNLILPITFLGITLLGIIFVFIILFLWWRSVKETWKYKTKRNPDTMVKTMAEFSPENCNFKIQIVEDTADKPRVEFIDENEIKIPIVTTRNYGGSPKLLDEPSTSKRRDSDKFVFPLEDTKEVPNEVKKIPKLPLPEHQWLQTHKKTIGYKTTIPRPLVKIVRSELGDDTGNKDDRAKKFSITRSPSLEKDEKSPFVSSAKSDKSDVFGFDSEVIKVKSDTIKVCVQPEAENQENVDRNFNNNVTPISPRELSSGLNRSISVDKGSVESISNLRRFRSVNTKLNICCINETPLERNNEKNEIQNSPKILECQSAQEKSTATKFNFSPKLLAEHRNSPQFFTPTDKVSPQFFTPSDKVSQSCFSEASPKSVYYDSVRSPKFFPTTPKSPIPLSDSEKPMSPKPFSEQTQNGSLEKQYSPRILISKLSPKVYSNKENYFSFDTKSTDLSHQRFKEETDMHASRRSPRLHRYCGRKSIEREKLSGAERVDVRKYRRHNSCETNYRNLENINTIQIVKTEPFAKDTCQIDETVNDNELATDYQNNSDTKDNEGSDVVDCTVLMQRLVVSPIEEDTPLRECLHTPQTAQERRQRLKSISLDSDNAKIIEQNLGIPVAKQLKEELIESFKDQEYSSSCENVQRTETTKFEAAQPVEHKFKFSPTLQKKALRDSSDPSSFVDMPRFSPKEFELTITSDESAGSPKRKSSKNPRNLTIDLSRRDSDLEKEILEFERLYTSAEERKPKTPTLKVKATSLDSSDSHLSIPQQQTLEVPQNSVSVPNTPKRQLKRLLNQKNLVKSHEMCSGGKLGYSSLQWPNERRSFMKDSIYLRDANLSIYQPAISRANSRRMGSFDENMSDFAENPEINIEPCDVSQSTSSLFGYKQNLSVSSTNLKTLPEGVQSNDFEPTNDDKITKKLHRRGSNQMLSLDSKYSLQSSNCSLPSTGHSSHNLASIRNSTSNFSLNTDNRKNNPLERRFSNASTNTEPISTTINPCLSSSNLQIIAVNPEMAQSKNCLLQRRGSNNSLTLNIHGCTLSRYSSNSSLNANKDVKVNQRKGLLERRSSNTSLTLNINSSNPQLCTNRGLSISNYNLNASTCNLSRHNSNQSVSTENKKGILERRSSNTSLTLNLQPDAPKDIDSIDMNAPRDLNVPRDIEVDENTMDPSLKDVYQHKEHRKSLSTENLIPRSYKTRLKLKTDNNQICFGSHDNLWSESYANENPDFCSRQNLTYVCGDQENEMIYAFGPREIDSANFAGGFIRNITTKPLSPQTTSEDFKLYLANIQHLQSASSILSREQLKDLNNVFQNGYSKVKCDCVSEEKHKCSGKVAENSEAESHESFLPCAEYQKAMLRNLHQEFWDLPTNFQEKPLVFGSHPKNRYKSILPNEHSRVILKGYGSDDAEGYINANFIKGHEYSRDSYIATQAPLQNTIYDFWAMVRQNTIRFRGHKKKRHKEIKTNEKPRNCIQKIVMLTNFVENNNQKCEKYFPLDIDEEITFANTESKGKLLGGISTVDEKTDDMVIIKNCGIIVQTGYTIRKLEVQFKKRTDGAAVPPKATTSEEMCCVEVNKISSEEKDKSNKNSDFNSSTDEDISYLSPKNEKLLTSDLTTSVQISLLKTDSEIKNTKIKSKSNTSCKRDFKGKSEFVIDNTESNDYKAETDTKNKRKSDSKDFADDGSDKESSEFINESITVHHYWFHNWADHKCPKDVNALLSLSLDILEDTVHDFETPTAKNIDPECTCTVTPKVSTKFVFPPLESQVSENACISNIDSRRIEIKNDFDCPPTVVHCSAGIGRTGCLIAILNGIKQLHTDHKVDVLGIVCNMRLNRGGMVQNSEQYELIHKVLCLYEQKCLPD